VKDFGVQSGFTVQTGTIPKLCLGVVFQNMTNLRTTATRMVVVERYGRFRLQKQYARPSIVVFDKDRAYFDGSNGFLELYGPATGANQQRKLLVKVDIRSMQGEFVPRLDKTK
jgi:hypothetical protein